MKTCARRSRSVATGIASADGSRRTWRSLCIAPADRTARSITSASEAIPIATDLDRLAQVFINLISNARKYCDAPRPELRVIARTRGGEVIVDFVDNGSGIPAPEREVIFESFARLTGARADRQPGGAGLGLAICREIMARLGGSIAYLPGQGGAAFRVTLPQSLAAAAAAE